MAKQLILILLSLFLFSLGENLNQNYIFYDTTNKHNIDKLE
jgi:hypothetical protein